MLHDLIVQLSFSRTACKLLSILLAVASLISGALGRLSTISLLLAAAPLVMLGLLDAGYAGKAEHFSEQIRSCDGKDGTPVDLRKESTVAAVGRMVRAIGFVSIWPFYLALWGIVAAGTVNLSHLAPPLSAATVSGTTVVTGPPVQATPRPSTPPWMVRTPLIPKRFPNGTPMNHFSPSNPALPSPPGNPGLPRPAAQASPFPVPQSGASRSP